ncbi:helix-turn-helix domain-containing protein [Vulcanisaeta distributa]|uniref:helix-turn-helix domain-containing protein n=1 Tax=Vulcanisaeta distributa TaxID=164451 RepID=UPI0006CFAD32|nr:helix-turn-helix domain-containing protein [Vulcanisaeta distributa]
MRNSDKANLSETALRIYLLLIREGKSMSIREIQRALGLSSPGQVYHHLERLRALGLVVRDSDGYRAVRRNGGVVEGAIILWSSVIPKSAFYLGGFSVTLTMAYVVTVVLGLMRLDPMALIALVSLLTFSIIEFKEQFTKLRRLLRSSDEVF